MKRLDFLKSLVIAPAAIATAACAKKDEVALIPDNKDPYDLGKVLLIKAGAKPDEYTWEMFLDVYKSTGVILLRDGCDINDDIRVVDLSSSKA